MKKIYSLVIIALIMILFPIHTFAVDYSIENMNIKAELQDDGDVYVTEEQTYKFDSKFKGITRTLIPKEGTNIANVQATENKETLQIEQEGNEYKIHRKGKDETITIELTYLVEEGVNVYSDVAEFSWPFFDTSNESDYEQFEATVIPPQRTNDVIAFGDDLATESEDIQENGDVLFDLGHVPSGKKGDIKVAYNASLFPKATITKDVLMRDAIIAEEQALKDEQIAFEKGQNTFNNIAPYIIGLFAIIFTGLLIFAYQKKQAVIREVNRKFPLPYFVPEEEMSLLATIFYRKSNMVTPEVLSAALMDLIRKGYVQALDEKSFKVVNRKTAYKHESLVINWLFDKIGSEGIFKVADIEDYIKVKANQKTYQKDYLKWKTAVQEEERTYPLFSKNIKMRLIVGAIGLLIIPFIIYFGKYELFMFMTFGIVLTLGFLAFAAFYKTRTILGERINRDWQVFQDKYPEMADDEWSELMTDDQKRAFIYGVGVKDKRIEQKNEKMLKYFPTEGYSNSNPVHFLMFATLFNSSFNDAQTTSAASSSSSAGGGTGVGGGGGGSGAF